MKTTKNQLKYVTHVLNGLRHIRGYMDQEMTSLCKKGYAFFCAGTVMCYGQTGAGKTFTITGATESYKNRGIIPRALSQIYKEVEDRPEYAITVR